MRQTEEEDVLLAASGLAGGVGARWTARCPVRFLPTTSVTRLEIEVWGDCRRGERVAVSRTSSVDLCERSCYWDWVRRGGGDMSGKGDEAAE